MKINKAVSIAPSILSADFAHLGEDVAALTQAGADSIHVDVMDGHFVPNLTLGPQIVSAIKRATHLPLDVHLMIETPERYINDYISAGASILSVHAEACVHLHRVVQAIRELGASPGVALNPATPLEVLKHILFDVDLVLIMTVNPGFGGQKPIPAAIKKIQALRTMIENQRKEEGFSEKGPLIEVDGGVKVENAADFAAADLFVSGSGIFQRGIEENSQKVNFDQKRKTYASTIQAMRKAIESARKRKGF